MGILKVACPGCAAVLKSKNPDGWAAGTRLFCPKCQEPIVAGDAPTPRPVKAVADDAPRPKKKPRPVEDDEDEGEDDRPARKKGGKKKPAGMSPAVYWSMRGAVLVGLLVVAGVLFMMFQDRQRQNQATEAENERIRQKNA